MPLPIFGQPLKVQQLVAPLIQVRLVWGTHHAWKARQALQFAASATALWLVLEGEVEVSDEHSSWRIGEGEAFLWSAASSRRIVTAAGAQWLSLGMQINFDNLDVSRALDLPVQWRPAKGEWESLTRCTRELVRGWNGGEEELVDAASIAVYTQNMELQAQHRSPIDVMIAQSLARAVFGMCWKRLADAEAAQSLEKRVPPWLVETLTRIHDEPLISVAALARSAGFSPAQFRRGFGEHVGVAPRSYLINYRLDIARRLLKENELPISAIAKQCGFSSLSHFIHMFKQSSGLSPSGFRQAARSAPV